MTKNSWNKFTEEYPNTDCLVCYVSTAVPKMRIFDKQNKKLPTPYKLFLEWLKTNLNGDWTATILGKEKGNTVFYIKVVLDQDIEKINKKWGLSSKTTEKNKFGCPRIFQIGYRDEDYDKLANELGYMPK